MYGESGSLVKPSIGPHDIMQRNSYIGSFVSRYYANGVIMTDHSPLIGVCTSIINIPRQNNIMLSSVT